MNACFSILVLTGTDVRHAWLTCRIDCRSSILYILTEAVDVTSFNHDESTFLTTILLKWANLKQIFCFFISIYYMYALQNHNQKLLIKTHFHKYRRSNHLSWCQYYKHEKIYIYMQCILLACNGDILNTVLVAFEDQFYN